MILSKLPSAEEFYRTYWNKKPFVVKGAIPQSFFDDYVDPDTLAGLSLEEDIKSRIVITEPKGNKWRCEHGPFEEDRFTTLGEKNWSLLVQNVEQYHHETANLLKEFNFAPRWLMDDIMVSYSTAGGSVGPHTDSYHVFLVQGMGKRSWKIGHSPVGDADYVEDQDLKILKKNFQGDDVEVSIGDVIYIPPNFAHEGRTIEEALTFSVGFLGPKLSEMLIEYGAFLEEDEGQDKRYSGQELDEWSAGFKIHLKAQTNIQNDLIGALQTDHFYKWLASYFSKPTHDEIDLNALNEKQITQDELLKRWKKNKTLYKPEHIKLTVLKLNGGDYYLAVYGQSIQIDGAHKRFINHLNKQNAISFNDLNDLGGETLLIELITDLYNQSILHFDGEDLT